MQDLMRNLLLGGGGGFSPQSLFTGGVVGAFYDPSDLSALYQDSAGTTPVTGVEQVVGLMLDKSQGLVLGPELVDTLNTTAAWTPVSNNTVTQDGNEVKITYVDNATGAQSILSQAVGLSQDLIVGKWYKLTFFSRVNSGSSVTLVLEDSTGNKTIGTVSSVTSTQFTYTFLYDGFARLKQLNMGAGEIVWVFGHSVRELPGNHATSTGSARPTLSARVNLLTYSEEFDNGAWTKVALNTTGTPAWINTAVAPNGTTTADLLIPNTSFGFHLLSQSVLLQGQYAITIYAKAGGYDKLALSVQFAGSATFNLSAGIVISGGSDASIQAVGDGWYRCSYTVTRTGVSNIEIGAARQSDGSWTSWAGDGTSGIYIWGADLRPTNIGVNIPSYQRIAAATNYDTNGFPFYLSFGGAQSMSTPANLDLTSTDKVTVYAGVRKSSTLISIIAESSSNSASNNGAFYFAANNSPNDYGVSLRGTAQAVYQPATYTAPISNVLATSYDIAGAGIADEIVPRVNGIVEQENPTGVNAGTGNFGTYPLYIGARAGSSLFFTGYLYSLIIQGTTASATQLASTEAWVNQKTKAY